MPLVTLTVDKDESQQAIDGLLDGVHAALVAMGVPEKDRFQRVLRLDADCVRVDPTYPDLKRARSSRFVLIEVTLSVGRQIKLKRQFAQAVVRSAEALGLSGEDVMILFKEVAWENWSFAGGRFVYAE
jgi:phenylpyruvate tautomerase PptA (4-oxalocrotonate tautomerase family)